MKTILVSVCASITLTSPVKYSKQSGRGEFLCFSQIFACRPSSLISKRLAESSEHADSESISFFSNFRFLRIQKQLKLLLGLCVCVRDSRSYLSARVQKKISAFWNNFI
jgi:hypothetical protein